MQLFPTAIPLLFFGYKDKDGTPKALGSAWVLDGLERLTLLNRRGWKYLKPRDGTFRKSGHPYTAKAKPAKDFCEIMQHCVPHMLNDFLSTLFEANDPKEKKAREGAVEAAKHLQETLGMRDWFFKPTGTISEARAQSQIRYCLTTHTQEKAGRRLRKWDPHKRSGTVIVLQKSAVNSIMKRAFKILHQLAPAFIEHMLSDDAGITFAAYLSRHTVVDNNNSDEFIKNFFEKIKDVGDRPGNFFENSRNSRSQLLTRMKRLLNESVSFDVDKDIVACVSGQKFTIMSTGDAPDGIKLNFSTEDAAETLYGDGARSMSADAIFVYEGNNKGHRQSNEDEDDEDEDDEDEDDDSDDEDEDEDDEDKDDEDEDDEDVDDEDEDDDEDWDEDEDWDDEDEDDDKDWDEDEDWDEDGGGDDGGEQSGEQHHSEGVSWSDAEEFSSGAPDVGGDARQVKAVAPNIVAATVASPVPQNSPRPGPRAAARYSPAHSQPEPPSAITTSPLMLPIVTPISKHATSPMDSPGMPPSSAGEANVATQPRGRAVRSAPLILRLI